MTPQKKQIAENYKEIAACFIRTMALSPAGNLAFGVLDKGGENLYNSAVQGEDYDAMLAYLSTLPEESLDLVLNAAMGEVAGKATGNSKIKKEAFEKAVGIVKDDLEMYIKNVTNEYPNILPY